MKNIAILASGSGTNAENIYKIFANGNRINTALIIYDRKNAGVADRMRAHGIEPIYIPKQTWVENPEAIVNLLRQHDIDLVVLAGFLRIIPDAIIQAFPRRIINIHPSLLPAYGGKGMFGHKVHEAVIENGETKSGVTVHYVTDVVDGGRVIMQQEVEITPDDTPETLEAKIHPVEYSLYPRAIVAALKALDMPEASHLKPEGTPTPAEEWAETLGIPVRQPEKPTRPEGNAEETPHQGMQVSAEASPEMPKTYMVWSIIMAIFFFLPAAAVAIWYSARVSTKYYADDMEGALHASERAQLWIIISFVIGVMWNTLWLPISLL